VLTNGAVQGTTTFYYDNEQVEWIEKHDSDGKRHGVQNYWYKDSDFKSMKTYKHGVLHGAYIEHVYALNEHVIYKGKFIDGVEHPIKTPSQIKSENKYKQAKQVSKNHYVSLICAYGSSTSRSRAIAQGKGEGSALGYMMKNSNSRPSSSSEARNYCTQTANIQGMNCDDANTYLSACMSKLRY